MIKVLNECSPTSNGTPLPGGEGKEERNSKERKRNIIVKMGKSEYYMYITTNQHMLFFIVHIREKVKGAEWFPA